MIRQVREWDNAKEEIILYKLKPGKKSPFCNPYYYDKNILEEFYVAHRISDFPEILQIRLLNGFEFHDYGLFIKNKLLHEIPDWPLFTDELGVTYATEKYEGWLLPQLDAEPRFWGIRPALVIKKESLGDIELAGGDLLFCSKLFNEPHEPEKEFQHVEFFSVLANHLLLCDKHIGKTKFDPFLSDCSEINKMIDEWYINFVDYFGF